VLLVVFSAEGGVEAVIESRVKAVLEAGVEPDVERRVKRLIELRVALSRNGVRSRRGCGSGGVDSAGSGG
jgi:hypothetical protein